MADPRNIALCFDGTWNSDDRSSPTNVVKTSQALAPQSAAGTKQLRYYDRGVGTGRYDRLRGGALGLGLARNVELAYIWLSSNYRPGDRVFLFGYSRGAYAARSLAGLIGLCGFPDLERCIAAGRGIVDVALEGMAIYRLPRGVARDRGAARHVEAFSLFDSGRGYQGPPHYFPPCKVHFIGVWDTVGALGVPITWLNWIGARRHRFHDVRLGRHVRHACHALAVDEGRRLFAPSLWKWGSLWAESLDQVWFPGVHSDVGGGRPNTALSDGALLWMWAKAHGAGLALRSEAVRALAPDALGEMGKSMSPVHRLWGRYDRPVGARDEDGGTPLFAGERAHFSAERRLHANETIEYRFGAAGRTLEPAMEEGWVPVATAALGEEDPESVDWEAPPEPVTPFMGAT